MVSTEHSRKLAYQYGPHIKDPHKQQVEAYKIMPLSELFEVSQVRVHIRESDMPGPATYKATCETCGIIIRDQKEVIKEKHVYCHACAEMAYYTTMKTITI